MADDWGLLDKDGAAPACCATCEQELDWVECEACGGEGEYDCYEEDPMWYGPGDMKACAQCGGTGGWYWCAACERID